MLTKLQLAFIIGVLLNLQWVVSVNSENVKNIIETLVIVDKEFADVFQHDYEKISNYLTVFFWDVNSRFKSLPSVDISIQIVDVSVIKSFADQPFIEDARDSDGRTYYETIFDLLRPWLYENRKSFIAHDLVVLITNSQGQNDFGISGVGSICESNWEYHEDSGAVVVYDIGQFKSMGVTAHEIGHALGALHDDDEEVGCPAGFLMNSVTQNNLFFFSKCTDKAISKFVNSKASSCLRKTNAVKKTAIDTYLSTPKAGTMLDVCKIRFGPKAKIDVEDEAFCYILRCQTLDKHNNYVLNDLIETVENIQCVDENVKGRCFRGRCRPDSKLLQHVSSGLCLKPESGFGISGPVIMVTCPTSKESTPLDTIELLDLDDDDGKLLASPYLHKGNTESGDKCFWIGEDKTDALWTGKCDSDEQWLIWNFEPVKKNSDKFYLINAYSGNCVKPFKNDRGSLVQSVTCTSDKDLIWKWFDGQ